MKRLQVQLRAGEQTTAFIATNDLAAKLNAFAETSAKLALEAKSEDDKRHHLARREAFIDTIKELVPA